ncbi:MAG TPA: DJ-1/PfpI family protein [Spirochaetia bacterium]|nr:DJ-1/PfpI family protein [Spirochaetia bacterium]
MRRSIWLLSLATLAFASPVAMDADSEASSRHPRIVMIVAPREFTDREYNDPRSVFEAKGALVTVASTKTAHAVSHDLARLRIDMTIRELTLDQFDAIVVVGGTGALTYLLDDEALRNLIVAASRSNKIVAAICVAPAVLARAGVLRDTPATCYPDRRIIAILKMNGADYAERSVVVSGRIVTANGPESAKDFAVQVLEALRTLGARCPSDTRAQI